MSNPRADHLVVSFDEPTYASLRFALPRGHEQEMVALVADFIGRNRAEVPTWWVEPDSEKVP